MARRLRHQPTQPRTSPYDHDRAGGKRQSYSPWRDGRPRYDVRRQRASDDGFASKDELDHYLDLLDARGLVAATTSSDDVENTKPAPDIFAKALDKLTEISVDEVIVVGDTPYDMTAANKCGIAAVAVRSGLFADDALWDAGAIAIYDDVAALLAEYPNTPLGQ